MRMHRRAAAALVVLTAVLLAAAAVPAQATVPARTWGVASCPATAGETPTCISDGAGHYYVRHGMGARPGSVSAITRAPYYATPSYELGNPAVPSTVIRFTFLRPDRVLQRGAIVFAWAADPPPAG